MSMQQRIDSGGGGTYAHPMTASAPHTCPVVYTADQLDVAYGNILDRDGWDLDDDTLRARALTEAARLFPVGAAE